MNKNVSIESLGLQISPEDDVIVLLKDLSPGDYYVEQACKTVRISETIPLGFKVAIKEKKIGEPIIRYGFPIGFATQKIHVGQIVHTHNLKSSR